jgi:hypothetical protein
MLSREVRLPYRTTGAMTIIPFGRYLNFLMDEVILFFSFMIGFSR